jgi:hypothetical protein
MSTIVSNEYREERALLKLDPIVIKLEREIRAVDLKELVHEGPDRTPRSSFMIAANQEYRARGGKGNKSIGAVAHAILELRAEADVD